MSFDKIISIPGMGGLFSMVAQMRNGGFVVESLSDGKRIPVSAMQRIIMLKDISVYTVEEDMPLLTVFRKMKEQDALASAVTGKTDAAELKATLKKLLPEFDEERVHASDIKKMFSWYGMLKDIVDQPTEEEVAAAKAEEEKPAKATKATKAAKAESDETAEAPKKTTRKKKAAEGDASEAVTAEEAPKKKARKTAAKSSE